MRTDQGQQDIRRIDTALINIDEHHRRELSDEVFKTGCRGLAERIAAEGLLVPIKVTAPGDGSYRLVFGLRRLTAVTMTGAESIEAIVAGPMTEEEIEAERMSENLNRLEASPIDEMLALGKLYDAVDAAHPGTAADTPEEHDESVIVAVAERIGRTPKWVRDRLYLRRLAPKVVGLVVAGRLPLTHARELAKLGSDREQEELARQAARDGDGVGGMSLDALAHAVSRRRARLDGVDWLLEVPFGGCRACEGCPHNTATDAMLFEGSAQPDKAMCTNLGCFAKKTKAAHLTIKNAVAKAAARVSSGKLPDAKLATLRAAGVLPEGVKETTVAARVRAAVKPAGAAGTPDHEGPAAWTGGKAAGKAATKAGGRPIESLADEAWRRFESERWQEQDIALHRRLHECPEVLPAVWAFCAVAGRDYGLTKQEKAEQAALLQLATEIIKGEAQASETSRLLERCVPLLVPKPGQLHHLCAYTEDQSITLGELLLGPMPQETKWKDAWIAEHEQEHAQATGKKAAGKKSGKKNTAGRAAP